MTELAVATVPVGRAPGAGMARAWPPSVRPGTAALVATPVAESVGRAPAARARRVGSAAPARAWAPPVRSGTAGAVGHRRSGCTPVAESAATAGASGTATRAAGTRAAVAPTALVVAAVLATSLLARDAAAQSPPSAGYRIAVTTLAESVCDRAAPFVRHELPHASPFDAESDSPFAGIGSGVAVGDVDDDGDLDLAFANLAGPGSVLINVTDRRSGDGPAFVPTVIANSRTRGVFLVDENADGALDLVFTRPHTPPQLWLGDGAGDFAPADRFGAWYPAMTMAWVDADRDGDLDIASATYDAEMVEEMGNVLFGSGVVYYERDAGRLEPHSLVNTAEALALLFTDLDGDGLADILVGNDFDREDYVYLRRGSRWELAEPFAATARNTMSFAIADLDNDGSEELFAADMKPFHPDAATDAAWEPVYRFYEKPPRSSLQVNENVLLRRTTGGAPGAESPRFVNEAAARGVDASGWSWSAKFGDLDSDGFADLYVVNGMIAADLFGHLPGNELVEENLAFRNDGSGHFTAAPEWGLGDTAGGRGMSMADIDRDGDLDIVINNIDAPAVLYENRLCGGVSAQVALHWPGSANPFAVGARLRLESEQGVQTRELRSGSGYLSGDAPEAHFGLGRGRLDGGRLTVLWPDGEQAVFAAPAAGTRIVITREQGDGSRRATGDRRNQGTGTSRGTARLRQAP